MRNGDVIALEVDENIQVQVDGVPVMECKYGASNGQYALRVERMLATEPGEPINGGKNHG
jgi:flagellar motor switch protein FliM